MSTTPSVRSLLNVFRQERPRDSDAAESLLVGAAALLLALRWADEYDAEQKAGAAFNREQARTILPLGLRWSIWRESPRPLTLDETEALAKGIRGALELPADPRGLFLGSLPSGRLLSELVSWVDQFSLDTQDGRRQAGESFSELVLQAMDVVRFGSEFITPQRVGRLMVALADPQPGERIYDPCFGTGGLLVDAAEALWARGFKLSPGEWTSAQRLSVFGVDRDFVLHPIAFVRLLLAGVRPALEMGDALERELARRHHDQGFDCVLADPPWGEGVKVGEKLEGGAGYIYDFPIKGRTSENLFLQHAVRSLRPGGRAIVTVPPGLLFRGGADYELRRWLLTEYRVEFVLRLPAKSLRHSTIAPNLLVVRCASPADNVRFVDIGALPETARASRALAQALLEDREVSESVSRSVAVAELLKADAKLVVPTALDAAADEQLKALGQAVEMRPLGDVARLVPGIAIRRDEVSDRAEEGAIPLVRVGNLSDGALRLEPRFMLPQVLLDVQERHRVRGGDLLISIDGSIGKVLLVPKSPPKSAVTTPNAWAEDPAIAIAQKGLVILRPHDFLDARFLEAVLLSESFQQTLRSLAQGDTIAHLSLRALRTVPVPVPPLAVQKRLLQRLASRPGDAVEALLGVLSSRDEDPLSRLLHRDSSIQQLLGEGLPEPEQLSRLVRGALLALRQLRNEVVHGETDLDPVALSWLVAFGNLPRELLRQGVEVPVVSFESLEATRTVMQKALAVARKITGLQGLQLTRLTDRLLAWIDASKATAARDFKLEVDSEFEEVMGSGLLRVTLSGTAALHDFRGHLDIDEFAVVSADDLWPGDQITTGLPFREVKWINVGQELHYPCEFSWSARRVDDQFEEGVIPVVLKCRAPIGVKSLAQDAAPKDLGVSPYITGDVVDSPEMFFGRKAIINDIKAHLGGGTKVILLEGNRRTGKTSILRQLQRPEMGLVESWIPVECSFQGAVGDATRDGIPTEGVFRLLVRDIGIACAKAGVAVPLPDMGPCEDLNIFRFRLARALNLFFKDIDPYEAVQIYVGTVIEAIAPRRLLLMLDEFDKLQVGIDNGVTSPQVPENIRNLLQTRSAVSAIITGSRRLKRLREEYWSALFGFGHSVGIEPLIASEVHELVTHPVAGRLEFNDPAINQIAELTARQPFLVQSLCARIFELAKHHGWRRIRNEQVLEGVGRMVRDNEHFQALWGYAETERRRYLLCLCNRLSAGTERVNGDLLAEHLAEAGIVVPVESVDDDLRALVEIELVALANTSLGPHYTIAVPLMRRWMDVNVDAEAQRRRGQREHQTVRPAYFVGEASSVVTDEDGGGRSEGRSHGAEPDMSEEDEGTR